MFAVCHFPEDLFDQSLGFQKCFNYGSWIFFLLIDFIIELLHFTIRYLACQFVENSFQLRLLFQSAHSDEKRAVIRRKKFLVIGKDPQFVGDEQSIGGKGVDDIDFLVGDSFIFLTYFIMIEVVSRFLRTFVDGLRVGFR